MKPPPKHIPKPTFDRKVHQSFAANPFDPREVGPDRRHTPLGSIIQCYWECRQYLKLHAPDSLKFLDEQVD